MARNLSTAAGSIVADICLYGTRQTGAGWLAQTADGLMFGNGRPVAGRSFTEAVWMAMGALESDGIRSGQVRIFLPGGDYMAVVDAAQPVPTFGGLRTVPAPVWTLDVADLVNAAQPQQVAR